MYIVIFTLLGFVAGGLAMMVALDVKRKRVNKLKEETERSAEELRTQQNQFAAETQREKEVHSSHVQEQLGKIRAFEAKLKEQAEAFTKLAEQVTTSLP